MKYVFIVNPMAGKGKGGRAIEHIRNVCLARHLDYEIRETSKEEDDQRIAREYKNKKCVIYACGGDGTLNGVLSGMIGGKSYLGVLPVGSGNDFYRSLSKREEEYLPVDIGKINDAYFINTACIGIDAEVAVNTDLMKKKHIPANQIYNASIVYTFFKYQFKELEFILNKTKKKDIYTMVSICNGSYYGNGYDIAPGAVIDDGLFDIYFVDRIPKAEIPFLLPKLKKGTHETSPHVHKRRAGEIKLISETEMACSIDGEIIYDKVFHIKVKKNAVTVYHNQELEDEIMKGLK